MSSKSTMPANAEQSTDSKESQDPLGESSIDDAAKEAIEALTERVEQAESKAQTAQQMASDAQGRLLDMREEKAALEAEIETLREENRDLEQRVDELQSRTDLMDQVAQGSAMKIDDRAAILIQTLYNEAWKYKQADTGDAPTASMDYNKAGGALGGTLPRSTILRTFKKADELVDGDIVRFKKESRSSKKNSRLIIDLREGKPPATISGNEITRPEVQ